jgi:flavin-dependent dehydrogenase
MVSRCDVAVVGGGPGGATIAALLARAGLAVVCFERERFPRFHVGESLLPATTPLFDRIGVGGAIEAAGFLRKHGAVFTDDVDGRQLVLTFRRGPTWSDHAYNVPRADFDRILLDHAAKSGASVFEGAEVREVAVEADGVRLGVHTDDGGRHAVRAAFLVDASGRDALLASRVGRREPMPTLGKAAFFAHYRHAQRWPGRVEGHIRIYIFEHGWFWLIPFAGDRASVGCVLHQRAVKGRREPPAALYEAMVAACPSIAAALSAAIRVSEVYTAANFSYRTAPAVGDRFVAIGDAVTFVDPIFSAGVHIAMQSAELAAETLVEMFRRGTFRADRFDRYRRRVGAGAGLFFHFIERYYDPSFLDVFFSPPPFETIRDAVTTVLAGGAFLRRPLWIRLRLAMVFHEVRRARARRLRRGLPVESRLAW